MRFLIAHCCGKLLLMKPAINGIREEPYQNGLKSITVIVEWKLKSPNTQMKNGKAMSQFKKPTTIL